MNNIKEFLARFWQHVVLHDASTLDAANAYTDEQIANVEVDAAGTNLGTVKSGGDVSISDGVITVNDDSHNHIISNIDNLQTTLDGKVPTSRTINGKALTANITLSASDVSAAPASAGLPTVSTSNNGKILQVSNGAWAVVDAPQGFSGSWNDLTNRPFTDMNALITEIKAQIGYPVVSATEPTLTNSNILWIDTSDNGVAKYHNGSAWVAITSVWK